MGDILYRSQGRHPSHLRFSPFLGRLWYHYWDCGFSKCFDWLVLWNMFYDLPFSWEFHHPNWRTHIFRRGRSTTNQIDDGHIAMMGMPVASDSLSGRMWIFLFCKDGMSLCQLVLPSGYVKIAIEHGHRHSGFTHWKLLFSIVMLVYRRVANFLW